MTQIQFSDFHAYVLYIMQLKISPTQVKTGLIILKFWKYEIEIMKSNRISNFDQTFHQNDSMFQNFSFLILWPVVHQGFRFRFGHI